MNLALAEKLKGLIAASKILRPSERDEWLMLLDLMNDKQMLELERILTPAPQVQVIPNPEPAPLPVSQAQTPSAPPLRHILNMPDVKAGEIKSNLEIKRIVPAQVQNQSAYAPTTRPNNKFLEKLNIVLKEPELPAGPKEELLPSGEEEVVEIFKQKQPTPPVVPLPPKKEPAVQPMPVQPVAKGIKQWPEHISLQNLNKPTQSVKIPQASVPEAHLSAVSLPAQKAVSAPPEKISAAILADHKGINIHSPQDFSKFDVSGLDGYTEKNIKEFGRHFGNLAMVENFEKSPLYAAYIKTGSEVLSKDGDFSAEAKKNPQALSKEQFEKVTDLLLWMQGE